MRPCNRCGLPIDNSAVLCADCEARPVASREMLTASSEHKPTEANGRAGASHWCLVFVGAGLRGIPAAIVIMVASQFVTWFRLPLLTTCYIGLGAMVVYALLGGLADLLPSGSEELE